jgi:carbon-monoxide dehydrogenase small subunit
LSALQLLESNPAPDDEQIREGIAGNICRCTGYVNIVVAIREAAKRMSHASSD